MATWATPGSGDIELRQNGSLVDLDVIPDSTLGLIDIVPDDPLDPTAPFELSLASAIEQGMAPSGPLWITATDPDCDTEAELQIDDDEDGFPDCHEKPGTFHWGMPLNHWGAEPDQVDVFVEVRYLRDPATHGIPWMQPWPHALAKVRDEFAANGYEVHFDVGDLYEDTSYHGWEMGVDWSGEFNLDDDDHGFPFVSNIDWVTPELDCNTSAPCGSANGWETWDAGNFLDTYVSQMVPGRERSFYFVLFANSADASASGRSHAGGRNAIITLGQSSSFNVVPTMSAHNNPADTTEQRNKIINYQAGVLMHEMGHMFGFREGGDWQLQGKPNYMSTMSYTHMFTGLPQSDAELEMRHENYQRYYLSPMDGNLACDLKFLSDLTHGPLGSPADFHIGYSSGDADRLDESALVESDGIGLAPWGMSGGIDWDCDGDALDSPTFLNITGYGFYPNVGSCGTSMLLDSDAVADHDDWGNLELYHRTHFLSGVWPNAGLPFTCAFP